MEPRIERAKQELRHALATLQPNESFNIIAFYGKSKPFSKKLVPANAQTVAQANQFLTALQLDKGTNLSKALERALRIPKINVIVVITDGVPTYGVTDFDKLAQYVRKLNVARARIFTIGLVGKNPDGSDNSFEAARVLEQIAKESNGTFHLVPLGQEKPQD